jgi:ribosomal protein S18 acetylase RimI-like enzyme
MNFVTVADNLRESFRVIAASRAAGENRELRGVSIASAGATFQMFNSAFLSAPVLNDADLTQRILLANAHYNTRGQEWAYWVCEDWLPGASRKRYRHLFERLGMRHSVDLPGMAAERIASPAYRLPPIEVRRVNPGPVRDAFCAIGALCFNVPISWFGEVFDSPSVWDPFAGYVAYVNEEPVSTAAIVMGAGAMGVYNVATVPGHRRRGYGEAVMRYALADMAAQHGIARSILQSTPAGYKLYQRMGYRTVTTVGVFSS